MRGHVKPRLPSVPSADRTYSNAGWPIETETGSLAEGECSGVPQWSVLGPLLWNLAYDRALQTALSADRRAVGFADDTLILADGEDWGEARTRAEMAVTCIVRMIRAMGMRVTPHKTEAIFMHGLRGRPPSTRIMVEETPVQVGLHMTYLGIVLALSRAFCSTGPPGKERPSWAAFCPTSGDQTGGSAAYLAIVQSVLLYGAPTWADDLMADRRLMALVRSAQRILALRIARAYRTVAQTAAAVLVGVPPLELLAASRAKVYRQTRELRQRRVVITLCIKDRIKCQTGHIAVQWQGKLLASEYQHGQRIIEAIAPILPEWLNREHGGVFYHMAQVVTGHGCFGDYLYRIDTCTTHCHHC